MYTWEDVLLIAIYSALAAWLFFMLLRRTGLSSVKGMLLGVAMIALAGAIIENKSETNWNEIMSVLGIGMVLGGLVLGDADRDQDSD